VPPGHTSAAAWRGGGRTFIVAAQGPVSVADERAQRVPVAGEIELAGHVALVTAHPHAGGAVVAVRDQPDPYV
jgi:hypothetical protein